MTLEQLKEAIGNLQHDEFMLLAESILDMAQLRQREAIGASGSGVAESRLQYRSEPGETTRASHYSNPSHADNERGGDTMTTVQITLPDQLAKQAEHAGLLAPERLEQWLRAQLKEYRVAQLFAAMDHMSAVPEPQVMSPEDVAQELESMRVESRSANK
jgi:hypothetical protein